MEQRNVWQIIKDFLHDRFDLSADTADQTEVHDNIQKSVEFKGTNLWILIFAIIIASVGLNVNSTAVIIGAMLISPLMSPITGIGYSLSINDFELLKKSAKNFAYAVGVSLITSTLYFMVTPLSSAQSELLARTTPSTWDVLIATFGGLAGIVAASRKERVGGTVVPGVAIATALMPPLCTAGFGLATLRLEYFAGALYLFFINAVFIALATFVVVRVLKYERKQFVDRKREKRVRQYIISIMLVTLIPSFLMTYSIVQETMFNTSARKFTKAFFNSGVTNIEYDRKKGSVIEVTMVVPLPSDSIAYARAKMENYGLYNTSLVVNQTSDSMGSTSLRYLVARSTDILLEKEQQINNLRAQLRYYTTDTLPKTNLAREIGMLIAGVKNVVISKADKVSPKGAVLSKKILCEINLNDGVSVTQQQHQRTLLWLRERTKIDDIELTIHQEKQIESSEQIHSNLTLQDSLVEQSDPFGFDF